MSLCVGLFDIPSWLDSVDTSVAGVSQRWGYILIAFSHGHSLFDSLLIICSPWSLVQGGICTALHSKVTFFPCVIVKYFVGRSCETIYPMFHQTLNLFIYSSVDSCFPVLFNGL